MTPLNSILGNSYYVHDQLLEVRQTLEDFKENEVQAASQTIKDLQSLVKAIN